MPIVHRTGKKKGHWSFPTLSWVLLNNSPNLQQGMWVVVLNIYCSALTQNEFCLLFTWREVDLQMMLCPLFSALERPDNLFQEWQDECHLCDGKIFSFSHIVLDRNTGRECTATKTRISCAINWDRQCQFMFRIQESFCSKEAETSSRTGNTPVSY